MVALNYTLDRLYMTINVLKVQGSTTKNVKDEIRVTNLKDHMIVNSHSKKQLNFNVSDFVLKGSDQFVKKMEEIYTEYELGINLNIKFKDHYDTAILNSTFVSDWPGDSEIMNQLYASIWNNDDNNDTIKQNLTDTLQSTYEKYKKDKSTLQMYPYFSEYFTTMKTVNNTATEQDY